MSASDRLKDPLITQEAADWHARHAPGALSEAGRSAVPRLARGQSARAARSSTRSARCGISSARSRIRPKCMAELRRAAASPCRRRPLLPRVFRDVPSWAGRSRRAWWATAGVVSWQWLSAPELYTTGRRRAKESSAG